MNYVPGCYQLHGLQSIRQILADAFLQQKNLYVLCPRMSSFQASFDVLRYQFTDDRPAFSSILKYIYSIDNDPEQSQPEHNCQLLSVPIDALSKHMCFIERVYQFIAMHAFNRSRKKTKIKCISQWEPKISFTIKSNCWLLEAFIYFIQIYGFLYSARYAATLAPAHFRNIKILCQWCLVLMSQSTDQDIPVMKYWHVTSIAKPQSLKSYMTPFNGCLPTSIDDSF